MALFDFLRRRPKRACVTVTDEEVIHMRPDGSTESMRWDQLAEVGILTTDEGPFQEDVFWMLLGADGRSGCAVPQGADGNEELLARLQQLPNFDNGTVIKAMGSTANASFTWWKRRSS